MPTPIGAPIRYMYEDSTTEMRSRANEFRTFRRLVATVAATGATVPPEYAAVLDRFNALTGRKGREMMDRLHASIVHGDGDPARALALAVAERNHTTTTEVLDDLQNRVLAKLRGLYGPVAATNYRQLADRFDKAADSFTLCAEIIDPGAPADSVVNAGTKIVTAWRDASHFADQLDQLIEPLCAAAELVRPLEAPSGLGVSLDPLLIPLVADVGGLHRREVWHAFTDTPVPRVSDGTLKLEDLEPRDEGPVGTRCGRWTRLHQAGAVIRAHPDPAQMMLFGQPQPMGWKPTMAPGQRRPVLARFDPHDDEATPRRRPLDRLRDALTRRRTPDDEQPEPDILDTVVGAHTDTEWRQS
ncbi:MAG: hypothetical protein WBV80_21955 [Mycobacterium sp.]